MIVGVSVTVGVGVGVGPHAENPITTPSEDSS